MEDKMPVFYQRYLEQVGANPTLKTDVPIIEHKLGTIKVVGKGKYFEFYTKTHLLVACHIETNGATYNFIEPIELEN